MVSLMPCLRTSSSVRWTGAGPGELKSWATRSAQARGSRPKGFPLLHTLAKDTFKIRNGEISNLSRTGHHFGYGLLNLLIYKQIYKFIFITGK